MFIVFISITEIDLNCDVLKIRYLSLTLAFDMKKVYQSNTNESIYSLQLFEFLF